MYRETVPNRHSRPTILLREAWREGQHVRKRTLANLTHWPAPKSNTLRLLLQDVPLVPLHSLFVVEYSLPHGAVEAVVGTMRQLGLDGLLASKPCRERPLVLAMIAERLRHPRSQLGTTRLWHTTTVAEALGGRPPMKTTCMPPWIGCWRAKRASHRNWPNAIEARGATCWTT